MINFDKRMRFLSMWRFKRQMAQEVRSSYVQDTLDNWIDPPKFNKGAAGIFA